jgi:hypothetical protein
MPNKGIELASLRMLNNARGAAVVFDMDIFPEGLD